jgi:hypothetical protein
MLWIAKNKNKSSRRTEKSSAKCCALKALGLLIKFYHFPNEQCLKLCSFQFVCGVWIPAWGFWFFLAF